MIIRNKGRAPLHVALTTLVVALCVFQGCGQQAAGGNSNTNWLRSCERDADCGGLACLCGICTLSCKAETCRSLDVLAKCVEQSPAAVASCGSDFPAGGICSAPCFEDGDCTRLSSSLACIGGACLVKTLKPTSDSGVDSGRPRESGAPNPGGDASVRVDSAVTPPPVSGDAGDNLPSCSGGGPGRSDCGPSSESCCTSQVVAGGTFYRSYDGFRFTDNGNPATVSDFRLDRYEVTVGRFRAFVAAVLGGWRPEGGSGLHVHLNGGLGLSDSSSPGTFESGWNASWNNHLYSTADGWNSRLGDAAPAAPGSWTPSPAANEHLPISRIDWYQAYAFCVWDGGFLPSEAEWNYAASGGSEQRIYPWSNPPSSGTAGCEFANYAQSPTESCANLVPNDVGTESPMGNGKWGQADLAGNVFEWNLDWDTSYASPCVDCAFVGTSSEPVTTRVLRGGSFMNQLRPPGSILAAERTFNPPTTYDSNFGVRCARSP